MEKKVNIFLDLDATLISSELLDINQADEGDTVYDVEKNVEKARKFNYQNMEGLYVIFERPHLQEFLTFLFANFNVSVWTAASQDYATFIIDTILIKNHPERQLKYFLCNYHGEKSSSMFKGSKDLEMLWRCYGIEGYTKENTIILDDYDEVWKTQKNNCIIAKDFAYFRDNSENDTFFVTLQELMDKMILHNDSNRPLSEIIDEINSR